MQAMNLGLGFDLGLGLRLRLRLAMSNERKLYTGQGRRPYKTAQWRFIHLGFFVLQTSCLDNRLAVKRITD